MSNEANKRARTGEELASYAMSPAALQQQVYSVPPAELQALVHRLLTLHPEAQGTFTNLRNEALQQEAERVRLAPPKDFSSLVSNCEYHINDKYARLRPSQQFNIVGDIGEVISDAVSQIQQACREDNKAATQVKGVEALVEIARDMINCEHGEIQKGLMHDLNEVADAITSVFEGMSDEDKESQADSIKGLAGELAEYGVDGLDDLLDDLQDLEDNED